MKTPLEKKQEMKMDKFSIGDFGYAKFSIEQKGAKRGIECYGTIRMIEKKYLLFEDNDKFEYIINRSEFEFEKHEFKIK